MDHLLSQSVNEDRKARVLSFACLILCGLLTVILGIQYIMPDMLVTLLKPIFVAACLVSLPIHYYKLSCFRPLAYLAVYYVFVLLAHPITNMTLSTFISFELFLVFFFFAGLRKWSKREIAWILRTVCIGCSIQAAIVLGSNPELLRSSGNAHILYLGVELNRNTAAFGIAPGGVSAIFLLFFDDRAGAVRLKRMGYLAGAALCMFTVLAIGCRSAFFSMAGGLLIMYWQKTGSVESRRKRRNQRALLILGIIVVYLIALTVTEGTYSARLLQFGENFDDSGRRVYWRIAWERIMETPVFGGGFDNMPHSLYLGTHNSFLTIMLYGGFIAVAFVALSFLLCIRESIRCRNLLPLAFMAETLMHSMTEPGFDYYAYIPLCLTAILLRYIQYQSDDVSTMFLYESGY